MVLRLRLMTSRALLWLLYAVHVRLLGSVEIRLQNSIDT